MAVMVGNDSHMDTLLVDGKRRIRIPAEIKSIKPGDKLTWRFDETEQAVVLRREVQGIDWDYILAAAPGVDSHDFPPARSRETYRSKLP
jgi:hypothetical protein